MPRASISRKCLVSITKIHPRDETTAHSVSTTLLDHLGSSRTGARDLCRPHAPAHSPQPSPQRCSMQAIMQCSSSSQVEQSPVLQAGPSVSSLTQWDPHSIHAPLPPAVLQAAPNQRATDRPCAVHCCAAPARGGAASGWRRSSRRRRSHLAAAGCAGACGVWRRRCADLCLLDSLVACGRLLRCTTCIGQNCLFCCLRLACCCTAGSANSLAFQDLSGRDLRKQRFTTADLRGTQFA